LQEGWPASSPEPEQRCQIFQAGKIKEDENPGDYWGKCDQGAVLGHQTFLALNYSNAAVNVRNPPMSRGWFIAAERKTRRDSLSG